MQLTWDVPLMEETDALVTAAALCAREGVAPRQSDGRRLRERLRAGRDGVGVEQSGAPIR